MKLNEFNAEVKELHNQVDKKITVLENETEETVEFIEKKALTYEELDGMIAKKNTSYVFKNKAVTVKAEIAVGSPVAIITDDEIKSKTFIRVYPADQQTANNLYAYTAENNVAIVGNQLLILLNSRAYEAEGTKVKDLTFNLIYRIYKSETSEAKGFIHTGIFIGEVINNG